jgi:two-component sensor histidine kinase
MVHVFKTGHKAITVDFIDISKRRQTEDALKRSEIEYRDTLNSLPDWIYVADYNFRFVMINASMANAMEKCGISSNKIGNTITEELPFFTFDNIDSINNVFLSGNIIRHEQRITLHDREMFAETTMIPIRKDGAVAKVIVVIRDRSKEKEIEELKQRSADQKEVMLREIHHRVKNNLAIVISLLTFQLNDNTNPEIKRSLLDIQTRIRAMALIHEHLYRSENLDKIPLATYIISLMQMIMSTYSGHRIEIETELDPIEVTIETALPVGLIINELLTNAFKYAFPGNIEGTVKISLAEAEGDQCVLTVKDNGIGLPKSYTPDSSVSLGLYIVRLLAEQMDGSLQIDRNKGTAFTITFRNLFRKSH